MCIYIYIMCIPMFIPYITKCSDHSHVFSGPFDLLSRQPEVAIDGHFVGIHDPYAEDLRQRHLGDVPGICGSESLKYHDCVLPSGNLTVCY